MSFRSFFSFRKPKTNLIGFEASDETIKQIDDLADRTGASGRADLFRDALRLYIWWTDKQDEGYDVLLKKDGEKSFVVELKRVK